MLSFTPALGSPLLWDVTLTPSADLVGPPGSLLEWGYSIQNLDPDHALVLNSVNAGVFQYGIPQSVFDFPIILPGAIVTGPLYQLQLDPNAPIGAVDSGTFDFTADFYTLDPDGGSRFAGPAADVSVPYSATVAAVPEPGTAIMFFLAIPAILFGIRTKYR